MQEQLRAPRGILPDLNAAVRYAEKCAWTPNADEYGVAAKFIVDAGIVLTLRHKSYTLRASVKWFMVTKTMAGGHRKRNWLNIHSYSISWINADVYLLVYKCRVYNY